MKEGRSIWWMVLIRGIALLLLGLLAVAWPELTFVVLAYIFALYILITGVLNTIFGIIDIGKRRAWFLNLFLGLAELSISVFILRTPFLTLTAFIIVLGFTFMIQGILEIIVVFTDIDVESRILDTVAGILGIIAGFFILRYPASGSLAFIWIIGIYGLLVGAIRIATALTIHSAINETKEKITPARTRK